MIATVTFDAGQTLIELDPTMLAARLAERGVAATPAALTAAQPAAWELYDRTVRAGGHARPWQVFMAALVAAATGVDAAHADALAGWLWSEQPRHNLWRQPVPGMIELARELADAGVTVGVLSNSEGQLAELLAELGWADEFSAVIDSGRVGVDKPDPQIFALTLDALGADAATTVHIGDSRSADIDGARAAGWRAIWFGPAAAATGAGPDAGVAVAADAAAVRAILIAWGAPLT